MTLGERILKYRKKAGISQEELADRLDVTRQSISLWETDQTVPSLDNLITLAKLFNISLDELCGREAEEQTVEESETVEVKTAAEIETEQAEEQKCFACAHTALTPKLLKSMQNLSRRKVITLFVVGILLGMAMIVGLAYSEDTAATYTLPLPIFIVIICAACLIRMLVYWHSQYKNSLEKYPHYVYRYLFYSDHLAVKGKSDKTETLFDVKYAEIKKTTQDNAFIYVFYDNLILPIEKANISEHTDIVLNKLKLVDGNGNTEYGENKVSVRVALILMFILSLLSIFIALFAVMIAVGTSPIPDYHQTMVECMWTFFLIIPLPLTSAILGIVYRCKKYKCTKNIVAGLIMCVLLSIYGSFTFIFSNQIGHDFSYVTGLEYAIGIDLPDSGYVSYEIKNDTETKSNAMIKFDNADEIHHIVASSNYFNRDTNSIPSNLISSYDMALTANYDYFFIYDITCGEYHYVNGDNHYGHRFIYLAYSVNKNIMYVLNFTY